MSLEEKFKDITIWEISEFWVKTYPKDIFITGPFPIPQIRELFEELLKLRKTKK
jgi:hypothetical protein